LRQRILAILGPLLGVALLALVVVVLRHEFRTYHLHDVLGHLRHIPARGLTFGLVLTALGYVTLTRYDALAFRYVRNSLPYRRIALASFVAYVFTHNVGLSFFGGSAVRYRMLSSWGIRAEDIARVIAFTGLTFWLGFFLLGGLVHAAWPLAVDLPGIRLASSRPIGLGLLGVLGAYVALVAWRRESLRLRGFRLELPGLGMTGVQLVLSSIDWLLAAAVLYAVLPASPGLAFPVFVGAYLLSQIAGLVSHVPGGLGVFETVMVLLLRPYLPGDQVLASIVAYRIICYLLPMGVAVLLFAGYEVRQSGARLGRAGTVVRGWTVAVAPYLFVVTIFLAGALLLFSGATPEHQEDLAWRFREMADRHGARPVFYEVSDDALPIYLELGLDLRKLGEVGRVPLPGFSLEGKRRSDLRQARNRMAREGCHFELLAPCEVPPVLDEFQVVSDEWLRSKNTREKRFSLGFFERAYLQRLPLAVVRRGDVILGFANVWPSEARVECSIDLMRYRSVAPKGMMEFLFAELMLWARDQGYQWFSLGMAPLSGFEHQRLAPLWNRLGALLFRHGEHFYNFQGLREFKDKFDPEWEPRYLASPGGLVTPLVLTRVASLVSGGVTGVVAR
jgi:lysylphosphatidylglycerol synthetase-like protein (DUF2156 family)